MNTSTTDATPLYKARVFADFEPAGEGEVRVCENEIVLVLREMGEWLLGSTQDGKVGYVKKIGYIYT